jgi:hypothetical protein
MDKSLVRREVVPFLAYIALLIAATIVGDFILHQFKLIWIGRYLGIPGTLLILLSFAYSLRKRQIIRSGNPRVLLALHQVLTFLGALMIMVHAGVHFYAVLPWLALAAMVVNVASGLIGRFLLERSRRHLAAMKERYGRHGLSKAEAEKELFWDAVTFDLMAKWRAVHFPITFAFAVLAAGHIVGVLLFWEWK